MTDNVLEPRRQGLVWPAWRRDRSAGRPSARSFVAGSERVPAHLSVSLPRPRTGPSVAETGVTPRATERRATPSAGGSKTTSPPARLYTSAPAASTSASPSATTTTPGGTSRASSDWPRPNESRPRPRHHSPNPTLPTPPGSTPTARSRRPCPTERRRQPTPQRATTSSETGRHRSGRRPGFATSDIAHRAHPGAVATTGWSASAPPGMLSDHYSVQRRAIYRPPLAVCSLVRSVATEPPMGKGAR